MKESEDWCALVFKKSTKADKVTWQLASGPNTSEETITIARVGMKLFTEWAEDKGIGVLGPIGGGKAPTN